MKLKTGDKVIFKRSGNESYFKAEMLAKTVLTIVKSGIDYDGTERCCFEGIGADGKPLSKYNLRSASDFIRIGDNNETTNN